MCQVDEVIYQQSRPIPGNAHQGRFLQFKMAYIENFDFLSVGIFRGLIVVIGDRTMKIGIQGHFCMCISKRP